MTDLRRTHQERTGLRPPMVAALLALSALLLSPAADAKLGDGVKVGSGRLKLGVEAGLRYDSMAAIGLPTGPGVTGNPGDGIGLLRGALVLDVPGESVKLNLTGNLDWNQFLGLGAATQAYSFFGTNLAGTAVFNPTGKVGVDVTETLNRSDRTNNPAFGVGVIGLNNTTRLHLRGAPGGGAIEVGGFYELGADVYSPEAGLTLNDNYAATCPNHDPSCDPTQASAFNSLRNTVGVDAKWRKYPKTGFTFDASYGWKTYIFQTAGTEAASPIKANLGFGTLLSTRFTFAIKAGYNGILFSGKGLVNNWAGLLEAGYQLTETVSTRLGYQRLAEPVAGAMLYFGDDRVYWELKGQFNRIVLAGTASLDFVNYGNTTRIDQALSGTLTADYNINDWLRLTSRLGLSTRSVSGIDIPAGASAAFNYNRWELGAGVATLF